jgi:hypothetical protein
MTSRWMATLLRVVKITAAIAVKAIKPMAIVASVSSPPTSERIWLRQNS